VSNCLNSLADCESKTTGMRTYADPPVTVILLEASVSSRIGRTRAGRAAVEADGRVMETMLPEQCFEKLRRQVSIR
jgi:hypothetical protein